MLKTKKWLLITGGFLAFSLWILLNEIFPLIKESISKYQELLENRQKINQALKSDETVAKLKLENKSIQKEIGLLSIASPSGKNLSFILSNLSNASRKSGINFLTIKPETESKVKAKKSEEFEKMFIRLNFKTKFHNLGKFLNLLESENLVVQVNELDIESKSAISDELNVEAGIIIYTLK
jgi:Tfp pilus assembly protein PilO